MPELDGIQATTEILKRLPDTAILILSMYSEDNLRPQRILAPARRDIC